jgi:HNH endonuclease
MAMVVPSTIGEALYWSYAQMAMAFASARHGKPTYQQTDYIVRGKIYYGLLRGRLKLGSLFKDEQEKIHSAGRCSYCGGTDDLSLDHLIPRLRGGEDAADNLVTACRSCNSSKGSRDLLEWAAARQELPALVLLRRYLKLAIRYCVRHDLMGVPLAEVGGLDPPLPFALAALPQSLPEPAELVARLCPDDE